jgi:hypothetical protein
LTIYQLENQHDFVSRDYFGMMYFYGIAMSLHRLKFSSSKVL